MPTGIDLPMPDADALAHSTRVRSHIAEVIRAEGGRIPFARYMELCLYAPGLGYYSAGSRKFGEGGDFVTAPELSSLFSRCLARQCEQILGTLGGGEILEFGAGSGVMAADILTELAARDRLPQRYFILEPSPYLQQVQRDTLRARQAGWFDRVAWLQQMPSPGFRGVVLANEVLDAMPVHRFAWRDGEVLQSFVVEDDGFSEQFGRCEDENLRDAVTRLVKEFPDIESGYVSDMNTMALPWVTALGDCVDAAVVMLIDYGYSRRDYYQAERRRGTLMCHYRHRAHADPFVWPGLQDITAHVDFTAVAEAGLAADMSVAGYTTQALFLIANGLDDMVAQSDPDQVRAHLTLTAEVKKLTLPTEMGDRFKVMALSKAYDAPLTGFGLRDFTDRL